MTQHVQQHGTAQPTSQQPPTGMQQPAPVQQGGAAGGQQPPQVMGSQQGVSMGLRFEQGITQEMQTALYEIADAIKVCEWCADQCLEEGPQMASCIRLCRDVTDIGALNMQLASRDSMFSPQAVELFVSAAEACMQECSRHSHAHCQDCAEALNRAVQATRQALSSFGGGQGGVQFGSQPTGQF